MRRRSIEGTSTRYGVREGLKAVFYGAKTEMAHERLILYLLKGEVSIFMLWPVLSMTLFVFFIRTAGAARWDL